MNFSAFFINRPIFASVISVIIFVAGALSVWSLPIAEYPQVVPPTVVVSASYPGANPKVIAETVASPLEQEINGIEGMLYQSSQSTAAGVMSLTVTFELGVDPDQAQIRVQNRIDRALPRLPVEVQRLGVTAIKSSPDLTMVVHLTSPNSQYDKLFLSNYANLRVKDELARVNGVGNVRVFGAGDYSMRIWLDPDKVAALNLNPSEIRQAIAEQNQQAVPGTLGAQPSQDNAFQLSINIKGRLSTVEEFENIIINVGQNGQISRLKDVARIELGSQSYAMSSLLDNNPAVALPIFQAPGSNAIQISDDVRVKMEELKKSFPENIDYSIVYDPTVFVRGAIKAVVKTLLEALLLVVLVVVLFLQTWRASIIPLVAVPVSLVGTFALMSVMGFSLNALSLFGLVLAIGIVVDDAIVVVENVERNIMNGLSSKEATRKAMREVTGPIIATTLVLAAVFIPTAFTPGLTGQFYKQFALTITISTIISSINSLTLSPALAALLLKEKGAKKDWLSKTIDFLFKRWLFNPFNALFERGSAAYTSGVKKLLRLSVFVIIVYAGLLGLTYHQFDTTPKGYIPTQDKQYLVSFAQLPDAASLNRTEEVMQEMSRIVLEHPGVQSAVAFPGLSINGFTNSSNSGILFVPLKAFDDRNTPELSAAQITQDLRAKFAGIQDAFVAIFPPPPVRGLGNIGGFRLQVLDKPNLGYEELYKITQNVLKKANAAPEIVGAFSSFQVNVPQVNVELNREQAQAQGIDVDDIFSTMQAYLGSVYVNDFNRFGRTYQVNIQADEKFRQTAEDVSQLKVRNRNGNMVPLGSFINVTNTSGPDRVMHYNGYTTAEINARAAPGYSSGQAQEAITRILDEELAIGMDFEWTDLTFQQKIVGNAADFVFPLIVLLIILVLAAQYESVRLPLSIVLIIPMTMLSAIIGVIIYGGDNNIFTQIGLVVLIGLATKNAILIVEFATELQQKGHDVIDAILEACRLRLRPILMTSLAFIMGVLPMVISTGAGSEMRQAIGVTVFSGMLGVTFFGLILTPVFYYLLQKNKKIKPEPLPDPSREETTHSIATDNSNPEANNV